MRNVRQYPAKADETVDAICKRTRILMEDMLEKGQVGSVEPYLLTKAAAFINLYRDQFEKFTADNP